MEILVPEGSIYFDCFKWGLRHIPLADVEAAVKLSGKEMRKKDVDNYWAGWFKSDLYHEDDEGSIWLLNKPKPASTPSTSFLTKSYGDYPENPLKDLPEIENRWVPCSETNAPMIKWSQGCMTLSDARAWPRSVYLAENTKGTKRIIIDCDGDHGLTLDFETIRFLSKFKTMTHCMSKPKSICEYEGYEDTGIKEPASFHLTFSTDRLIPTMHFAFAGIDIIGNEKNSLRYLKNKIWNGVDPASMTEEIWKELQEFIRRRKDGNTL